MTLAQDVPRPARDDRDRGDTYPLWHPMTGMRRYLEAPSSMVRGRGSRLVDADGVEYVSANAGLWNVHCGYDEPRIARAIEEQLSRLAYGTLFRFGNEPALQLASRLLGLADPRLDLTKVFYGTSGGSGVDAALKLARRYQRLSGRPERRVVAALGDSYHGTLSGPMAVTGEDLGQGEYGVDRSDTLTLPTPIDEQTTRSALDRLRVEADGVAAIIVEPILGSGGVVVPTADFFRGLSTLCEEQDIVLVVDEVATGFGRTGRMFAFEHEGLRPDLVVTSKGINGGYLPLSAVLVHERIWRAFQDHGAEFLHGETQAGNPLACAAAIATLGVIEEDGLVERARTAGKSLADGVRALAPLARGQVEATTGRGLMLGVHLRGSGPRPGHDEINAVVERFRSLGVIVHASPRGFSLMPPLTIDDADLGIILDAARTVFEELELS